MNTMVILVNERPESRAALDWTLKGQPATTAAGDTKLRVVLGPSTDIPGGPRYVSPSLVDEVTTQIRNSGITHTIYAESTDPAHQVITLAGEVNADLVVIGLPTRNATLKLFIGSHARDILVDAPCPVVAVKE